MIIVGRVARKHHYIPQFYLEGFTTEDNNGRLFVLDQKTQAISLVTKNNEEFKG